MKTFKAAFWSMIYILIFYVSQLAGFTLFSYEMVQRRALDYEAAVQVVIETQSVQVLGVAAILGIFVSFLLVSLRRLSFNDLIEPKVVGPLKLGKAFLIGVSLNIVLSFILQKIQAVDQISRIYSGYLMNTESLNIGSSTLAPWAVVAIMCVVLPIYEEIMFRGLILRECAAALGTRPAIWAQAIIFGFCHGNAIQGLFAFILALILGHFFVKDESIWSCSLMHIGFNLVVYLAMYL